MLLIDISFYKENTLLLWLSITMIFWKYHHAIERCLIYESRSYQGRCINTLICEGTILFLMVLSIYRLSIGFGWFVYESPSCEDVSHSIFCFVLCLTRVSVPCFGCTKYRAGDSKICLNSILRPGLRMMLALKTVHDTHLSSHWVWYICPKSVKKPKLFHNCWYNSFLRSAESENAW